MKKILFITIAAVAALVSCSRAERPISVMGDDLQIRFTTSVGTYSVKSSDAGFDNGDAIGITALSPINTDNVKYIYRDGALVPEGEGIKWVAGQETPALFYAIYPYRENFHMNNDGTFGDFEDIPGALLVEVESDQSTYDGYSRSNQFACSTTAAPGEEVKLSFYHTVAKVVISVENKLDTGIKEVYLSNIYGRYLRYDGRNAGNLGSIKANPDGESSWKALVVPQSAQPVVVIKTEDGKEYDFDYPGEGFFRFYQGDQYKFSVVLDNSVSASTFTSEVEQWSEDKEYVFDNANYMKRKALASLLGEYEATSSTQAYSNPWTITLVYSGGRIGFDNLFSNPGWAGSDTMFYGDLNDDGSAIVIPCGQNTEYMYGGETPITLFWLSAEDEEGADGNIVATLVRDEAGNVTGLDFGELGWVAYVGELGYVGYAYPTVTAQKVIGN